MVPIWHDGPLAALYWDGVSPVAWSLAHGSHSNGDRGEARARRGGFARALIGRLAGVRAGAVLLTRSAAGAPVVSEPAGWHLGLSSCGARALLGAARNPIAVDCELVDDAPPLWDMLTVAEADALRRLPAERWPSEWLRRWTIKEAHAKLTGDPRRIAPEMVETRVMDSARALALHRGTSHCWTRMSRGAIETVAQWAEPECRVR